ncbi:sugar-binding transcriptional regulator [Homoserinibacter sp. GY 40078]|uniref:sugar-binding transcriptional regulator n=1 Tax=Homoserinibacter sp. GY 40078 TaxID=2603275 RepID=UPI00165055D6|nr:sugar-binding domain-containing protein [Homoserinibacter sp. GY 40078]
MYYIDQLNQDAIARRVGMSRQSVSRLLGQAMTEGIVHIEVRPPAQSVVWLEDELSRRYRIPEVRVVETDEESSLAERTRLAARAAARMIAGRLDGSERVAVAWGRTILEFAYGLPRTAHNQMLVVQMNGSALGASGSGRPESVATVMAEAWSCDQLTLSAPLYVDTPEIREILAGDTGMRRVLDAARRADVAVFSLDTPSIDSGLYKAGLIVDRDLDAGRRDGAVGEICGQFYDADGRPCTLELSARCISITLDELARIPTRVCVAVGEKKIGAIQGALSGGYATFFATDAATAELLLR